MEQEARWVTDGSHIYPHNVHLDELLARGELKFCDPPVAQTEPVELQALRKLAASKGYTLPNRVTLEDAQRLYDEFMRLKAQQAEEVDPPETNGFPQ